MARVRVEVLPWVSDELRPGETGHVWIEADGATLHGLLKSLAESDPAFARLVFDLAADRPRDAIQVLVNDRAVAWLQERDAPLSAGDRVTLVPAYAGG